MSAETEMDLVVLTVPEAGRKLGLGRNAAYSAARRGQLPIIKIGRQLRVPKLAFAKMLEQVATPTDVA